MKNVLYISHHAKMDGAPRCMLDLIKSLGKDEFRPVVIIPEHGVMEQYLKKNHIKYYIIPYKMCAYKNNNKYSLMKRLAYEKSNLFGVIRLLSIIKKEKIEMIHTNTTAIEIGAWCSLLLGIPHIWHVREFGKEDFDLTFWSKRRMKFLFQQADVLIAMSKILQSSFYEKYKIMPVFLYDGMDVNGIGVGPIKKQIASPYKLFFSGSILSGKGQKEALQAVRILKSRGINVLLTIVGSGDKSYLAELKEYVKKENLSQEVQFLSFQSNLTQLRNEHDIALVCSRSEGFGRVTIEAMLSGIALIGADAGGTTELIGSQEERGYLYTLGNPTDLSDKIQYCIEHWEETISKKSEAQKFAIQITDTEKFADKLKHIYRKKERKSVRYRLFVKETNNDRKDTRSM